MEAKLIKTIDEQGVMYSLSGDNLPENYVLSLKNCQDIERGYDLDELAENTFSITPSDKLHHQIRNQSFKLGFQKALEILGDKKFSEDDMKEAYSRGFLQQGIKSFNSLIQSLQQTEWDCIIEMECIDPNCDGINRKGECMPGKNPKIDASGCLILKRK